MFGLTFHPSWVKPLLAKKQFVSQLNMLQVPVPTPSLVHIKVAPAEDLAPPVWFSQILL